MLYPDECGYLENDAKKPGPTLKGAPIPPVMNIEIGLITQHIYLLSSLIEEISRAASNLMTGLRFRGGCKLLSSILQPTTECCRLLVPAATAKRDVILTTLDKAKWSHEPSGGNIIGDKRPRRDAHAKSSNRSLKHKVEVLKLGRILGYYFYVRSLAPILPS